MPICQYKLIKEKDKFQTVQKTLHHIYCNRVLAVVFIHPLFLNEMELPMTNIELIHCSSAPHFVPLAANVVAL